MRLSTLVVLLLSLLSAGRALADAAHPGTLFYDPGIAWDTARVTSGKTNATFVLQSRRAPNGPWITITYSNATSFGGTTDADGNWSGSCTRWTGVAGKHPDHNQVRILWSNGTTSTPVRPQSWSMLGNIAYNAETTLLEPGYEQLVELDMMLLQNAQTPLHELVGGQAWIEDGGFMEIILADQFVWDAVTINSYFGSDLAVQQYFIDEQDPRVLVLQFGPNQRQNPFASFHFSGAIQYDGNPIENATAIIRATYEVDGQGGLVESAATLFENPACVQNDNDCSADINGDGIVDVNDLLALFGQWGACR